MDRGGSMGGENTEKPRIRTGKVRVRIGANRADHPRELLQRHHHGRVSGNNWRAERTTVSPPADPSIGGGLGWRARARGMMRTGGAAGALGLADRPHHAPRRFIDLDSVTRRPEGRCWCRNGVFFAARGLHGRWAFKSLCAPT